MHSPVCQSLATSGALLGLLSVVAAHGHDEHINVTAEVTSPASDAAPESYFQYGQYSTWILAHIAIMTLAWVFILPVGVMFSIARSRYSKLVQLLFLACNALGLFLGVVYNMKTPDLYPNNAHHKLGWILTGIVLVQFIFGVVNSYVERRGRLFMPISRQAMFQHQRTHGANTQPNRFSYDSGHGTEANTESRSSSCSEFGTLSPVSQEADEESEESHGLMSSEKVDRALAKVVPRNLSTWIIRVLAGMYNVIDRVILLLGFAAICTGWVTYGGLFTGERVFSGLAHFIKGGIFFWYGILTLGRWSGSFADIGWAWNMKPADAGNKWSAEFVESFIIFIYGTTNVFLEHLTAWGNEWSAIDLEHIALTGMFFGGGLCGMLIESKRLRELLSTRQESPQSRLYLTPDKDEEEPVSYQNPMNPIPALVILLLGIMMSSHHQDSMVSTMIHGQWGKLLTGAAFARGASYILNYLSPPKSVLPGRPPTELITAFCLMAGGFIFMASARDVVATIENHNLDAMFVFTVSMGLITFLMAWVLAVLAMKGWAVKRENKGFRTSGVA